MNSSTNNTDWLAERFEEHRTRLRSVAYRMLGSLTEADDAVQEGWLRLSGSQTDAIENLVFVRTRAAHDHLAVWLRHHRCRGQPTPFP
jgi:DNA-directed RNA polymerase specialized sigma24 family protein